MDVDRINQQYNLARSAFLDIGVDVDDILKKMDAISLSTHCWQGDDVGGFESLGEGLEGSGLAATGNYPGKARTPDELRQDFLKAFELIPGNHRVNLHAMYGEFMGQEVDRDEIEVGHFQGWIDWARENNLAIDFNPTLFAHPKAKSGFTLSNKRQEIRDFWIRHIVRCREIANAIGKELGNPCINNLWIPDGSKDNPVDRAGFRAMLLDSLDQVYAAKYDRNYMQDFMEGKLFGIGSEAFVVGSHEFYLGYAIKNQIGFTMDMGHYHPTESIADKVSAILPFVPDLLIHISRGLRWDSDHVAIQNDDLLSLGEEIVRSRAMDRIHLSLDYFDASINRIGAWVIGARATLQAIIRAMLQPWDRLDELEENGQLFDRLALLEQLKAMPWGAVWDAYCMQKNVPAGLEWIYKINEYEKNVLSKRE